jgi:hypothetical protein
MVCGPIDDANKRAAAHDDFGYHSQLLPAPIEPTQRPLILGRHGMD